MPAQNTPCKFDEKTFQFAGSPVEQARCLLRPNGMGGVLSPELKKLPNPLEKLIGQPVVLRKDNRRNIRRFTGSAAIRRAAPGQGIYTGALFCYSRYVFAVFEG